MVQRAHGSHLFLGSDSSLALPLSLPVQGVEPVLRTYNTCLIACNMCNQPREALAVYHRLLTDGFAPNSTTMNALISAYGKTAQLDKALDVYREMLRQNMERSVITYSSLISACEKAGQWETALNIFNEMTKDGCAPNTVTFNSLITACAQGARRLLPIASASEHGSLRQRSSTAAGRCGAGASRALWGLRFRRRIGGEEELFVAPAWCSRMRTVDLARSACMDGLQSPALAHAQLPRASRTPLLLPNAPVCMSTRAPRPCRWPVGEGERGV